LRLLRFGVCTFYTNGYNKKKKKKKKRNSFF